MEKLEIIDEINKDKTLKFLAIDKKIYQGHRYIGYSKQPKMYVRLAEKGTKEVDTRIYPIFDGFINNQGSVIYITGKKGSGKTIFLASIASDYHKLNPHNKIYYICSTSKNSDENLIEYNFVHDFNISELNNYKILDDDTKEMEHDNKNADPIFEHYNNCLFLFDDLDSLSKRTQTRINRFQNLLLELGRKKNISVVIVSHFETNYKLTRLLIRELDYYITFNDENIKMNRFLNNYKKFDTSILHPSETYLILNYKYNYAITNKRTFIID